VYYFSLQSAQQLAVRLFGLYSGSKFTVTINSVQSSQVSRYEKLSLQFLRMHKFALMAPFTSFSWDHSQCADSFSKFALCLTINKKWNPPATCCAFPMYCLVDKQQRVFKVLKYEVRELQSLTAPCEHLCECLNFCMAPKR